MDDNNAILRRLLTNKKYSLKLLSKILVWRLDIIHERMVREGWNDGMKIERRMDED